MTPFVVRAFFRQEDRIMPLVFLSSLPPVKSNVLRQTMKFARLIFPVIFIIPAILMGLLAAYVAGGTTLACQRVEPAQIDCTLSYRRWLGMVDTGNTQLKYLKGAHLEAYDCTTTDANGRTVTKQCESLVLDTAAGEVHPDLLTASAGGINQFIAARETTLTVYNNRWIFSGALSGFALVWFGCGYFIWRALKGAGAFD